MFSVYVLYSPDYNKYYIGQTKNLENRISHHNLGLDSYTKKYKPWVVVFNILTETRTEAILLEKKLKNLSGQRLLEFIKKYKKS